MLTRGREARARASPDTVLSPLPRCFVRVVLLLLPADTGGAVDPEMGGGTKKRK